MNDFYKLLLFFTVGASFLVLAYLLFRYFHRKIEASKSGISFVIYALVLLLINAVILTGGFFAILRLYGYLSGGI